MRLGDLAGDGEAYSGPPVRAGLVHAVEALEDVRQVLRRLGLQVRLGERGNASAS